MFQVKGACLDIDYVVLGALENNVYLIGNGATTLVVDPSCDAPAILAALGERSVDAILLTHYHYDHVGAAAALRASTGAPVIASAVDAPQVQGDVSAPLGHREVEPCPVDHRVDHGDVLQLGDMPWKVIATPGHSPGSVCYYIVPEFGNHADGAPVLVAGDTLFCGSIGRTDFLDGSMADMRASLRRLAVLPDETIVLPGHGPLTTIGAERQRVFARFAG
ncbi:MAG: MBL fold metallo-hydrolase [Eggerthellaceae bacterium]|nr:MBL fold metallo-hydrolase [Eggerthellaceae bacterium]